MVNDQAASERKKLENPGPNISEAGPWAGKRKNQIEIEFKKHLQNSSFPEDFPGIARSVSPNKDRPYDIVCKFSVPKEQRDGLKIPCNVCLCENKFESEGILLCDENGWLFLCGPQCARRYFGASYAYKERIRDAEVREARAENYLLDKLPLLFEWESRSKNLLPLAKDCELYWHKLRKSNGGFVKKLRDVFNKDAGILYVDNESVVHNRRGKKQVERYRAPIGQVQGEAAVGTKFPFRNKLEDAIRFFSQYCVYTNEELLDFVIDAANEGNLDCYRKLVIDSARAVVECRQKILSMRDFFSEKNFQELEKWTGHPSGVGPYKVILNGEQRIVETSGARTRFSQQMGEFLKIAIPEIPDPSQLLGPARS